MRSLFSSHHPTQPGSSPLSSSLSHPPSLSHVPNYCSNVLRNHDAQTNLALRHSTPYAAASPTAPQHARVVPKYALGCSYIEDEDEEDDDHKNNEDDNDNDVDVAGPVEPLATPPASDSSLSSTSSSYFDAAMSIRNKAKRQASDSLSTLSLSKSATAAHDRPTTPTLPVQIPKRGHHDNAHQTNNKRGNLYHPSRRQYKHVHSSPDAIPSSVAALLAITDIPRPHRTRRAAGRLLSVAQAASDGHVTEKTLGLSPSRGPLDLLLSPPEDLMDDDLSATESIVGSLLVRSSSADSVPSLGGESCATEPGSPLDSPRGILFARRRRSSLLRKSLEPVRSPPDATEEHPLAATVDDAGPVKTELLPLVGEDEADSPPYPLFQPFKPLRFAFKSNLTASLRALRSAAKSFSSFNFSYIPADDFLTRSILTIDPNVPYMDERRPPIMGGMPSAELRRYLNPTTSNHFDAQPTSRNARAFSASIQLQTYKIQRSRSPPPLSRTPTNAPGGAPVAPPSSSAGRNAGGPPAKASHHQVSPAPGMRQREMRENPDFIRVAVMEMAMRRRGKLDNQKPGRARWALPPRRQSAKPYEVSSTGIPTRWIPMTY